MIPIRLFLSTIQKYYSFSLTNISKIRGILRIHLPILLVPGGRGFENPKNRSDSLAGISFILIFRLGLVLVGSGSTNSDSVSSISGRQCTWIQFIQIIIKNVYIRILTMICSL
jgi:hypothetical protein